MLLAAAALVALRTALPLMALRTVTAGIGMYGLSGLFLTNAAWRRGAPLALAGVMLVPLAGTVDLFLGFPARRAVAAAVAHTLDPLGVAHVSTATVLVVDGRAAAVDLPCAGMRSLWSIGLLLAGATWLERRPLDRWFVATSVLSGGLLIVANGLRVAVLVGLDTVAGQPLLAKIVHLPLGILGFGLAGAAAWGVLRCAPTVPAAAPATVRWTVPGWSLAVGALFAVGLTSPAETVEPAALPLHMPGDAVGLTAGETQLFDRFGATAQKISLPTPTAGTAVFVASRTWRAQHPPRMCLEAGGATLDGEQGLWLDDAPVRFANVTRDGSAATALWWFQSGDQITDDATERMWAGLGSNQPWIMVSVVLDGAYPPNDRTLHDLVRRLRSQVHSQLEAT
jgi:exosortase O